MTAVYKPWPRGRFKIPGAGNTNTFLFENDPPIVVNQSYIDSQQRIDAQAIQNPDVYKNSTNTQLGLRDNLPPEADPPQTNPESVKVENAPACGSSDGDIASFLGKILGEAASGKWYETGDNSGNNSNPNIVNMWTNIALPTPNRGDQTPWCMVFVQWVLKNTGHLYIKSPSTSQIGQIQNIKLITKDINQVPVLGRPGDILYYSRTGGGHVTFLYQVGSTLESCKNCGGNQSAGGLHKDSGGDVTSSKVVTNNFVALYRPSCQ